MKKLVVSLSMVCFLATFHTLKAQDAADVVEEALSNNYKDRSPFYDYTENSLNNTDSIPDFASKSDPLKITGTIYQSDGTTPAKDVILYIYQPDENGFYDLKREGDKRYVYHRGWVKTNADGKYTFYTFIPGSVHRSFEAKHIHAVVKAHEEAEHDLNTLYFDNDPLMTKHRRKRLTKKGLANSILTVEKKDTMFITTKDIVLGQDLKACK